MQLTSPGDLLSEEISNLDRPPPRPLHPAPRRRVMPSQVMARQLHPVESLPQGYEMPPAPAMQPQPARRPRLRRPVEPMPQPAEMPQRRSLQRAHRRQGVL